MEGGIIARKTAADPSSIRFWPYTEKTKYGVFLAAINRVNPIAYHQVKTEAKDLSDPAAVQSVLSYLVTAYERAPGGSHHVKFTEDHGGVHCVLVLAQVEGGPPSTVYLEELKPRALVISKDAAPVAIPRIEATLRGGAMQGLDAAFADLCRAPVPTTVEIMGECHCLLHVWAPRGVRK